MTTYPEVAISSSISSISGAEQDGIKYAKEIAIVKAFSILVGYEDGTFKASGALSRAELAFMLTRFAGKESLIDDENGETPFSDVNASHWASGCINIVTKMGWMSGYADGTFLPEAPVTLEHVAIGVVSVLGYAPMVGPLGYVDKANTLGVTSGTSLTKNSLVSRGALARLMINALEIPLVQNGVILDGYASLYRETTLSNIYSAAKLKAVVMRRYDAYSVSKQDQVRIDILQNYETKFYNAFEQYDSIDVKAGNTAVKSLVGYPALMYVRYNGVSVPATVLYCAKDAAGQSEVTIGHTQIKNAEVSGGVVTVTWNDGQSPSNRTLRIYDNANVYINGVRSMSTVFQALTSTTFYGYVSFALLDSRSDQDYDTAFFTCYTNTVVDSVNPFTGRVTPKAGAPITFANDDSTSSVLYDLNGNVIDWKALKKHDVISFKLIEGTRRVYEATLVGKAIQGKIMEVNGGEFTIGGDIYYVDGRILTEPDLQLLDEGTFYLDILGNITYFAPLPYKANYAYVMDIEAVIGIQRRTEMKLFTGSGEVVVFVAANQVKFKHWNGAGYVSDWIPSIEVADALPRDTFIAYTLNSSGQVNEITLTNPEQDGGTGLRAFSLYASSQYAFYSNATRSLKLGINGKRVYLTEDTVIMLAPPSVSGCEEEEYQIVPFNMLDAVAEDWYAVEVYDVNDGYEAGVILVRTPDGVRIAPQGISPAVAAKGGTEEDGSKLTVLQNGKAKGFGWRSDWQKPAKGAVILVEPYFNGAVRGHWEIARLAPDMESVIEGVDLPYINMLDEDIRFTVEQVTGIKNNMLETSAQDVLIPESANVYVYEETADGSGKVYSASRAANVFYSSNTYLYDNNNQPLESVYMCCREVNGRVTDAVLYLFRNGFYEPQPSEVIELYTATDFVGASVSYRNETDDAQEPVLVLARYKNGRLVEVSQTAKTAQPDELCTFKDMLISDLDNGETVKAMLLDGLDSMKPLTPVSSTVIAGERKAIGGGLTVNSGDVTGVQIVGDAVRLTLSGTPDTVDIAADAGIYVNGIPSADVYAIFNDFYGESYLQDYDSAAGRYRSVYFDNYTNFIVDYVDKAAKRVFFVDDASISYDESLPDFFAVLMDTDGSLLEWTDLQENDVLSARGAGNVFIATRIRSSVTGSITAFAQGVRHDTAEVDGVAYAVYRSNIFTDEFILGQSGIFYLDRFGRIAYADWDISLYRNYGYVYDYAVTYGIRRTLEIALFTRYGDNVVLSAADRVTIMNHPTLGTGYALGGDEAAVWLDAAPDMRFIQFDVNDAGAIETIVYPLPEFGVKGSRIFSMYAEGDDAQYFHNTQSLWVDGRRATVTDKTEIFLINPEDNRDSAILSLSDLVDDYGGMDGVSVYDVGWDGAIGAVLMDYRRADLTSDNTGIAMIQRTSRSVNSDGDDIYILTYLQDGQPKTVSTVSDGFDLQVGDVIVPRLNSHGELQENYRNVARINASSNHVVPGPGFIEPDMGMDSVYYLGEISDVKGSRITIEADFFEDFIIPSSANVYVYDEGAVSLNRVRLAGYDFINVLYKEDGVLYNSASHDELASAYVLIREYKGKIVDVVIYLFI